MFQLNPLFTNHMVLQRELENVIYGTDTPLTRIKIQFRGISYTTTADGSGKWSIVLAPASAGGPFVMELQGSIEMLIEDILIGDVFVLSGQSNMELMLKDTIDVTKEKEWKSATSNLRYIRIEPQYKFQCPAEYIVTPGWQCAEENKVAYFSAVGYFFAKEIIKYQNIPVGLINTSVGGSCIEAWMSRKTLEKYEDFEQNALTSFQPGEINKTIAEQVNYKKIWKNQAEENTENIIQEVFKSMETEAVYKGWERCGFPEILIGDKHCKYQGTMWYRKDFYLDQESKEKGYIRFGLLIDQDSIWINGVYIGSSDNRYAMRYYTIPSGSLKKGKNTILVRLTIEKSNGGSVPEKPYFIAAGGHRIEMSGCWWRKKGISMPIQAPDVLFPPLLPLGLYYGALTPLKNLKFKAILWYQGESNVGHKEDYEQLFFAMKQDWEHLFNRKLSFCCVQLAGYQEPLITETNTGWAMIREYQRRVSGRFDNREECGMVTAIDLGERYDLHPHHKQELGRRLALWARNCIYGENVEYRGPELERAEIKNHEILLYFSRDDSQRKILSGFEISLDNKKFEEIKAVHDKHVVHLYPGTIKNNVLWVRYAWKDYPGKLNFYNSMGLPAGPFSVKVEEIR